MKKRTPRRLSASMPTWETLEQWAREQIQEKLQDVLEEEVTAFLGRGNGQRRAAVDAVRGYRNGYQKPRRLAMSTGTITVRRPRVREVEERFESRLLPLFRRRTEEVAALLPEFYLHGLSQGDFELALRGLLGDGAPLSASSIERLKARWQAEYETWTQSRLDDLELVYVWADGIYVKAGLEKEKACLLVVCGALADGTKRVLAVRAGYRESTESWKGLLLDLKARGLEVPKLLVADGIAGLWAAVGEVWPQVREQRCWNHKITNVLDQLPKKLQARVREELCAIPYAETRREAERLRDRFARTWGRTHPNAVAILLKDWNRMVAFYDFPKEHWKHLRTTNVVESPFASVRLRTDAAKRYKRIENATALIWRLLRVAESRFRKIDAPHLALEVYNGARFVDGVKVTKGKQKVAA